MNEIAIKQSKKIPFSMYLLKIQPNIFGSLNNFLYFWYVIR